MSAAAVIQENWQLLTGAGATLATGVGTGVTFAFRFLRRMEKLESENRQLRLDVDAVRGELKAVAENHGAWQNRTARLEARLSDARGLREEVRELDRSLDKVISRLPDYVRQDVFVSYVNEQRSTMNEVQRNHGQIEGTHKRI